ncbi:MAG: hypothetical protein LBC81_04085 [Tannerellaceae bacterium]|nr:hypothetical protein [Tannerellaceae bacterium]
MKKTAEEMMTHILIYSPVKLAEITLIGASCPGVAFHLQIFPGALSERVISVCKKRLAPRQMPVIKLSNNTAIEYARLEF